ncbi:MAG: translational GTPase TypA [Candidatus Caldatribacteriota bacterium]|nr:translational GTPase TypA [Candidatus Caldatribacteriota bacterium]
MKNINLRSIAIIAHVDHGKTTLVDVMLRQSGTFRENQEVRERVMDSNDLERERGITILSKNTSVHWHGVKINIVDTPGHADFGGEVERILRMVNGVLLIVDAFEGPMPQTRFVLRKAMELNLIPIVVINKIDRPTARPAEVLNEIYDLFIELGASDEQIDFPVIYTSARAGVSGFSTDNLKDNLEPLFSTILKHIPAPSVKHNAPLQLLVTNLDYDDYVGKIVVGLINRGKIEEGEIVSLIKRDKKKVFCKVVKLYIFEGLKRKEVKKAESGEIVAIAGIGDANIGETIACKEKPEALLKIKIDQPTLSMDFIVNNSPFAGKEGKFVTSRHLRERLLKEIETNVSLKVEESESTDTFHVSGRGELHLSILIENMRREGYEFQVSKPKVIFRYINGEKCEPIELMSCDVPKDTMGVVMEICGKRKAKLINMIDFSDDQLRLEFEIPARGLIGFRDQFLTKTKGKGIMHHLFLNYQPYKGYIPQRSRGVLIVFESGLTSTYGLYNAQARGTLFVNPVTEVYQGMIIGENRRAGDMEVNVAKKKHVTNMRASGSDEALRLENPRQFSLEQALNYIQEDELLEITPSHIRLRKKLLDSHSRYQQKKSLKDAVNS